MAAAYQAKYDYSNKTVGLLSFRSGDKFTVKNRTNDDWWTVQDGKGEMGLVPVSYLEPLAQGQDYHDGSSNGVTEGVFTTLYDFTGQDSSQLTFKKGEQLMLLAKTDVSWWTMRSPTGLTGLVPLNYINIDMTTTTASTTTASRSTAASTTTTASTTTSTTTASRSTAIASGSTAASTSTVGVASSQGNPRPHPQNGGEGEALSEVLLSIDRAMQKIHDEAVLQGGFYNPHQKTTLQQLAVHRKGVVESCATQQVTHTQNHTPSPNSQSSHPHPHTNSTPSPSLMRLPHGGDTSQLRGVQNGNDVPSSRPKRKAPAPPSNPAQQKSDKDPFSSLPRRSRNLRSSREDLLTDYHSQTLPTRDTGQRDRSRTLPQHPLPRHKGKPSSNSSPLQNHVGVAAQQQQGHQNRTQAANKPTASSSPNHRRSETHLSRGQSTASSTFSAVSSTPSQQSQASSSKLSVGRSRSVDIHTHTLPPSPSSSPSSSRRHVTTSRTTSSAATEEDRPRKISLPPGLSPKSSPVSQRRQGSTVPLPEEMPPFLPTQFPSSDGADLIAVVRGRTHLSYAKSVQAVTGVLELLKDKIPQCAEVMDGLLSAVQQSHASTSPSTSRKVETSADMDRLREIFFQLQDVRDDSQQRGWAVHDDLNVIMEYLSELLQILCDADPEVTKRAVQEDKYENILTLISYYDMESRIPIRLLMLQVFGVLCGLDKEIVNVLLSSILPNELGRDIHNHLTEIEKTLYTSTVCTMIFSTGEAVPLTIYDQWSESYISFLMDTIENPPEEDYHDQVPDSFLNVILSFNQHFTDPETNLVMNVLKTKKDPRHFSEKFMFLINRGEDPVALQQPLCPDALTKFALDVFSSKETSGMFYTTDLMVLIDIVLRQISDLCPGDELRTHYLELLYRIANSTDYRSHYHRQKEITTVLNRIAKEEGSESQRDHDIIKKVWIEHSGCFDEITDL